MRVLIANRGEIARRIERTCERLGHEVVGIWVDGDTGSHPPVLHGDVATVPSYLDQAAIIAAAVSAHADAIHPGFGFLAENAEFADAVVAAGLTWIGPRSDVIAQMGSKIRAREIAEAAGVPLIPGYVDSQADDDLAAAADRIGYPVLVKASAGGGGKGIRIARSPDEFSRSLSEARAEADRSFGDTDVMVERYIERPRHIEVQVIGDRHGQVFHIGTRECSIQRRYQKLFEEAPAPNLPDATREGLHAAAVQLADAVDYDSAGTVEFIVDDETGDFFFLEMNTRLQVEHPVTEEITGLDLVELMLCAAEGHRLPDLSAVEFVGHSLEARITAEDANAGFVPGAGVVSALDVPAGVRWESALAIGTEVTPEYDAMIAKLVVTGTDRSDALARMASALDHLVLAGVVTTAGFHRWLIDQGPVRTARVTTRFLDETEVGPAPEPRVDDAGRMMVLLADQPDTVWHRTSSFSLTPHTPTQVIGLVDQRGEAHEVALSPDQLLDGSPADGWVHGRALDGSVDAVAFNVAGHTQSFRRVDRSELWAAATADRAGSGNALVSPFPAAIAEVHVSPGQSVEGGQVLVVIEAMKMLHSLTADGSATVDSVLVAPGDQVSSHQPLVTFTSETEQDI